jgi:cyclopropane fatty-acyl-phospholipid synthase-like methyltransferase
MEGDALTAHEIAKAPESMGRYLAELDRTDVDVLDFGCGWGGETLWLADRVRSVWTSTRTIWRRLDARSPHRAGPIAGSSRG